MKKKEQEKEEIIESQFQLPWHLIYQCRLNNKKKKKEISKKG